MNLSVIITVFNRTAFLQEAIESALAQRHVLEILVVDDGSDEVSKVEIENIVSDFDIVQLIRNDQSRGVSFARNRGVKAAKGDFIVFLDDDDVLNEGYFEQISGVMAKVDLLFTKADLIGDTNSKRFSKLQKFYNFNRDHFHLKVDDPLFFLAYVPPIHGIVFRKSILENFQFPEDLSYGEDRVVLMQMKESEVKMKSLDITSCGYRVHNQPKNNTSPIEYLEFLKSSDIIRSNAQKRFVDFQRGYFLIRDSHFIKGLLYLFKSVFSLKVLIYQIKILRLLSPK